VYGAAPAPVAPVARYGGIDKALIWPTYTNIGIDDRNTFDLIRSMPVRLTSLVTYSDHAAANKVGYRLLKT